MGMGEVRVLVVDDQALMRAGTRAILEAEEDIEVVGEAADGAEAVELAGRTAPAAFDVVVGDDGAVDAEVAIRQSRWGIKPYSGLLGALKVADDVRLVLEGRLPRS